uniref:Uncharacterized protein n=1 Tax=Vespula pensylvanica TaxID=30213 RepID=A0A834KHU7_VESPE|nr:hypothetical protein H0235_015005 [Vespula pensylvanica]
MVDTTMERFQGEEEEFQVGEEGEEAKEEEEGEEEAKEEEEEEEEEGKKLKRGMDRFGEGEHKGNKSKQ